MCRSMIVRAVFLLFLFVFNQAQAELILSAPPRESAKAAEKLYAPLAKHLTRLLGERVTYKRPDNWLHYQRELRSDKYDVVFDGPHFVSWRIKKLQHEVLVRLPDTLEFVIVARKDAAEINSLEDLIGKKICGISPPSLATMVAIEQYPFPARQPYITPVRGGYKKVAELFGEGVCHAAVFRSTYYYKKMSAEARATTKMLFISTPLPNQAISVSSRIDNESKAKIIKSLTQGEGLRFTNNIVRRFTGKTSNTFVIAQQEDYLTQVNLLEGVIFGW